MMDRRIFIKNSLQAGIALGIAPSLFSFRTNDDFKVIQLTQGPKQHWFGYYDKQQIDPSGRYVLGMQLDASVNFRSPEATDKQVIGMVDLFDNNKWIDLDTSFAWNWQQGCLLQWMPGSEIEIIWNDRQGDRFVSHIMNVRTRKKRTIPRAIYAITPDGRYAVTTDFARLQKMRPGYGYAGVTSPYEKQKAPADIGIWKIDLKTGEETLIINIAEMSKIPNNGEELADYWHWFNHILISPDGKRFNFLHRWRKEYPGEGAAIGGFSTRMYTANLDGSEKFCIDPSGDTSHFYWRDPSHITAWTRPKGQKWGFYLLEDRTGTFEIVGEEHMTENGHNTYVPNTNNEWILNDTYPSEVDRKQTLFLYHVPTKKKIVLGRFFEPQEFKGEWRCDLHPRASLDKKIISFDSTHEGGLRQMYMIAMNGEI